MNTLVINLTRVTQHPQVRLDNGKLDSIQIVPQGRVNLRAGMTVDARWLSKNPQTLRVENLVAKPQFVSQVSAVVQPPPAPAPVTETKGEA